MIPWYDTVTGARMNTDLTPESYGTSSAWTIIDN